MSDIESQVLEAVKEVLDFNDPKTIKASIILARIRTILGLKDLASAPDLYEALKGIIALEGEVDYAKRFKKGILKVPANRLNKGIEALAKAEGK